MEYVKRFLHVEGTIGQGAFGRVLQASSIQNQSSPFQQQPQQHNHQPNGTFLQATLSPPEGQPSPPISADNDSNHNQRNHLSPKRLAAAPDQQPTILKTPPPTNHNYSLRRVTPVKGATAHINENLAGTPQGPKFALKCVHPILKPQRLANELRHLRDLGGLCNVVQMHTAHFNMGSLFIVMELVERDRFMDYVYKLDYGEIVSYMKNLLIALEHVHSKNIMHRDIKPANFLYNRKDKKFLLVDFGLAQTVRSTSRPPVPASNTATPNRSTTSNSLTPSTTHQQQLNRLGSPTTTFTTATGRRATALFPESFERGQKNHKNLQLDKINYSQPLAKANISFVNLNSCSVIKAPNGKAVQYINLTPNSSPNAPNVSTKRQLPDPHNANDFSQMLKKLRVSSSTREPVKLTVGAYESPVTHTDSGSKHNNLINHKQQKLATPLVPSRRPPGPRCDCRGKPKTCSICMSRPEPIAPKSGTPGFKAPEILLRYMNQTTAIDIWSAGVIMLYLLSGHAPFFRDVEDVVGLAEIITIIGSQRVTQAARAIGVKLNIEPKREPMDLAHVCRTIRKNSPEKRKLNIPDSAFDLLKKMLDPNPLTRITASDALKHPWLRTPDEAA